MHDIRSEPPVRAPRPARPTSRPPLWVGLVLYAAIAAVLFVLVAVFASAAEPWYPGPSALGGWVRADSGWYRNIAQNGYFFTPGKQSSVAFFPAYPLATRGLHNLFGGDWSSWGVAVTFASGALVAGLFFAWCRSRMVPTAALTSLLVLLLWPYAWYLFGAVYADALFVAMVLLAFTLLERDHPVLAGIAGAVATATRPVGIAVVLGLVLRLLERRGALRVPVLDRIAWLAPAGGRAGAPADVAQPEPAERRWGVLDLRRLRRLDPLVVLAAGGLLGYMAYLWRTFDEPLAFAKAESAPGWDQSPGAHTWLKFAWFSRLVHLPGSGPRYFAFITFQAVLALALLALVPLVLKRFGWGYAVYTLGVLAIPLLGSKDFMGIGRYALTAFPSFAVLGQVLDERPRARVTWLASSAVLLVALTVAFSRAEYVA